MQVIDHQPLCFLCDYCTMLDCEHAKMLYSRLSLYTQNQNQLRNGILMYQRAPADGSKSVLNPKGSPLSRELHMQRTSLSRDLHVLAAALDGAGGNLGMCGQDFSRIELSSDRTRDWLHLCASCKVSKHSLNLINSALEIGNMCKSENVNIHTV